MREWERDCALFYFVLSFSDMNVLYLLCTIHELNIYVCSRDSNMILDYIRFLKLSKFVIGHFDKLLSLARARARTPYTQPQTCCVRFEYFSFFPRSVHLLVCCLFLLFFFLIHYSLTFLTDVNHTHIVQSDFNEMCRSDDKGSQWI